LGAAAAAIFIMVFATSAIMHQPRKSLQQLPTLADLEPLIELASPPPVVESAREDFKMLTQSMISNAESAVRVFAPGIADTPPAGNTDKQTPGPQSMSVRRLFYMTS